MRTAGARNCGSPQGNRRAIGSYTGCVNAARRAARPAAEPAAADAAQLRPTLAAATAHWPWVVPALALLLLVAAVASLMVLSSSRETYERQQQQIADALWLKQTIQYQLDRSVERVAAVAADLGKAPLTPAAIEIKLDALLAISNELAAAGVIAADGRIVFWENRRERIAPDRILLFATELSGISRKDLIEAATRLRNPTFLPAYDGPHGPAFDVVVPIAGSAAELSQFGATTRNGPAPAFVLAVFSFQRILDDMVPWWLAQDNEIRLSDAGDTLSAVRAVSGPGRGVVTHQSAIELSGLQLLLAIDQSRAPPDWLSHGLRVGVATLSVLLAASLWLLWRDVRKRFAAEAQLRDEYAFRKAIGDSLVTGLRARDLDGRVTYVNPSFCAMVGYSADELIGRTPPMPFWAPEYAAQYERRQADMRAGRVGPQGFETVFQRRSGERFPVMIYEAPLLDAHGRQTGWMSSIVDLSDQKKRDELTRLQQERLQTAARLTTMGEIASSLAHELNQPLAAIRSYLVGSLNLLERNTEPRTRAQQAAAALYTAAAASPAPADFDADQPPARLRNAQCEAVLESLQKADAQAERAGRIIRRVHDFVRRREPQTAAVDIAALIADVLPLVELQARKTRVRVCTQIEPNLPQVAADRIALEQVLLNLTRNAIEAMHATAPERAALTIGAALEVAADESARVVVSVRDRGCGIDAEVAAQLFRPFFTTKAEGMGMGLSICRTLIESHGGDLSFDAAPDGGTIFRFALPARSAGAALTDTV